MNKLLSFFLFLSLPVLAAAQSHLQWTTTEYTPHSQINESKSMATDALGDTYAIHFTQSELSYYVTYRFFRYNASGTKMWQYDNDSCFTDCNDKYQLVVPLNGNGAIFIGAYDDLTGPFQVRIKHIGINGDLVWQNHWVSPMIGGVPVAAMLDNAGHLVIGFRGHVNSVDQEDFVIAKFDTATGANIWHTEMPDGGPGGGVTLSEQINSICVDEDDNIYGCGSASNVFASILRNMVFRLNSAGVVQYSYVTAATGIGGQALKIMYRQPSLYMLETPPLATVSNVRIERRDALSGAPVWLTTLAHDSADIVPADMLIKGDDIYTLYNYRYFFPDSSFAGGVWGPYHHNVGRVAEDGTVTMTRDIQNGLADQLGECNDALYITSSKFIDSASLAQNMVVNKMDTAGNTIWADSTLEDFGLGAFAFDAGCRMFVSRSARLTNDRIIGYTQMFADEVNGVVNINSYPDITLYPNPVTDKLEISISNTNGISNLLLSIFDMTGRNICEGRLTGSHLSLSLANLHPGAYAVRITQNGHVIHSRLISKL